MFSMYESFNTQHTIVIIITVIEIGYQEGQKANLGAHQDGTAC